MLNSAIRKGRYISFKYNDHISILFQIKNSTIIKKPKLNFDIFNIPVECIEIHEEMLFLSNSNIYIFKYCKDSIVEKIIIKDNDKYYIPLTDINFPSEEEIKEFQKQKIKKSKT